MSKDTWHASTYLWQFWTLTINSTTHFLILIKLTRPRVEKYAQSVEEYFSHTVNDVRGKHYATTATKFSPIFPAVMTLMLCPVRVWNTRTKQCVDAQEHLLTCTHLPSSAQNLVRLSSMSTLPMTKPSSVCSNVEDCSLAEAATSTFDMFPQSHLVRAVTFGIYNLILSCM